MKDYLEMSFEMLERMCIVAIGRAVVVVVVVMIDFN